MTKNKPIDLVPDKILDKGLHQRIRSAVTGALDITPENLLARFQSQYQRLPQGNILDRDSTWERTKARLLDPRNADKLQKVLQLQRYGLLYAVMEDSSLEFMDDIGNKAGAPPVFLKDKNSKKIQIIFNYDSERMDEALHQVDTQETHEWASILEMLRWAKEEGFGVFEGYKKDDRSFGRLMKLAEAASPTGHFIGNSGGPQIATVLGKRWMASFNPENNRVYVSNQAVLYPGQARSQSCGLIRRINI